MKHKKNEIMPFTTWVTLKNFMWSKINQTQKEKCLIISFTCEMLKKSWLHRSRRTKMDNRSCCEGCFNREEAKGDFTGHMVRVKRRNKFQKIYCMGRWLYQMALYFLLENCNNKKCTCSFASKKHRFGGAVHLLISQT